MIYSFKGKEKWQPIGEKQPLANFEPLSHDHLQQPSVYPIGFSHSHYTLLSKGLLSGHTTTCFGCDCHISLHRSPAQIEAEGQRSYSLIEARFELMSGHNESAHWVSLIAAVRALGLTRSQCMNSSQLKAMEWAEKKANKWL